MNNSQSIREMEFSWILQHSNDLIITLLPQGEIINISRSAANLYRWDSQKVIGTNYFEQLKLQNLEPPISQKALNDISNKCQITQEFVFDSGEQIHTIEWLLFYFETPGKKNQFFAFLG